MDEKKLTNTIEVPGICLIDINNNYCDILHDRGYTTFKGTRGNPISTSKPSENLILNCSLPFNINEYDILVLDLCKKEHQDAIGLEELVNIVVSKQIGNDSYNSDVYASLLLAKFNRKKIGKKKVSIIFAGPPALLNYHEKGDSNKNISSYCFNSLVNNRAIASNGYNIHFSNTVNSKLRNILSSFISEMYYEATFNVSKEESTLDLLKKNPFAAGKIKISQITIPLLENEFGDIVSFYINSDKELLFVFPQMSDESKNLLLDKLFAEILPSEVPELFPKIADAKWANNKKYWLPNHGSLIKEEDDLYKEYGIKHTDITNRIKFNMEKYNYLHKILICDGDELKDNIIIFLDYLGFNNIIDPDEINKDNDQLEEDIRFDYNDTTILVEVKGLGGTSTDSDCSQISKIVLRKLFNNRTRNYKGVYIVNYQKFLSPDKRKEEPFQQHQIDDAKNLNRGMMTTLDLFMLRKRLEKGIISKEFAREQFLNSGRINFELPESRLIGVITEIFKSGSIGIICLCNKKITLNQEVIVKSRNTNDIEVFDKIICLQSNDVDVEEASNGEIGIKLINHINKGDELYYSE